MNNLILHKNLVLTFSYVTPLNLLVINSETELLATKIYVEIFKYANIFGI